MFIGLLQQVVALLLFDCTCGTMFYQRGCRGIERHADILWCRTGLAHVFHLVPAVTASHANVAGGFNHLAGPFIIQHVQCIVVGQRRLMYEGPPQLRFTASKQFPDKILLYIHILMKQLA